MFLFLGFDSVVNI